MKYISHTIDEFGRMIWKQVTASQVNEIASGSVITSTWKDGNGRYVECHAEVYPVKGLRSSKDVVRHYIKSGESLRPIFAVMESGHSTTEARQAAYRAIIKHFSRA